MEGTNKFIGYLLLLIGILFIVFAVFNGCSVFTGKSKPYNLFSFKSISMDLSSLVEGAPKNAQLTQELITSDMVNKPLNLVFNLMLMGFISTIGYKIASLGIMLLRTIKVNVKEERSVLFPPR